MKKIINPWKQVKGYNCFGCAEHNPIGLKMDFYEDGEDIVSFWTPTPDYQGWLDTLHGGIQATLLDEISAWVIVRKLQTFGVTAKMETRYIKSISTQNHRLTLRAHITERKRNLILIDASIADDHDEICTTATCTYFCMSPEKAKSDLGFQGCFTEDEI